MTMKIYQFVMTLGLCSFMLSCQQKQEAKPAQEGLSGTWILFQSRSWDGTKWVTQPIPASPQRTLTFTYPHQLSAVAIDDTMLSRSTYFEVTSTGIIGPAIHLKISESSPYVGTFTYTPPQDILYMNSLDAKASIGYSFRRL